MEKISLSFLVRNRILSEQIWRRFLEAAGESFSVRIHAAGPGLYASDFLRDRVLPVRVPSRWGCLLDVELALLEAGLEDEENSRFVFASESCLPLHPASRIADRLLTEPRSWIPLIPVGDTPGARRPVGFPGPHLRKNPQWIVLNRPDAELLVSRSYWREAFRSTWCNEEHYPSSLLSLHDRLDNTRRDGVTFTRWERPSPHPLVLDAATLPTRHPEAFACLFARKFEPVEEVPWDVD